MKFNDLEWPLKQNARGKPMFDVEYLRNSTRERHGYTEY